MFPLAYFKQFTMNSEYQIFSINQDKRTIEINGIEVDTEILKECGVRERHLNEFFKKSSLIKSGRKIVERAFHNIDVSISNISSQKDNSHILCVKVDCDVPNNDYNQSLIECLKKVFIETWNELFEDCLKVSQEADIKLLKPIQKLYRERAPKRVTSFKDFHNFTMDILRADALTLLEWAFKDITKEAFKFGRFEDDEYILFDSIVTEGQDLYLEMIHYKKISGNGAREPTYKPYMVRYGQYHKPSFRDCELSEKSLSWLKDMTTAKEVKDILFE